MYPTVNNSAMITNPIFISRGRRGMAAPRIMALLVGFWSCYQDFGVKCRNISELLRKAPKKGI